MSELSYDLTAQRYRGPGGKFVALDMSPAFAVPNPADRTFSHAVLPRQGTMRRVGVVGTNCACFCRSQLSGRLSLAMHSAVLAPHVVDVGFGGANKQMIGAHAGGVIAMVQHPQAVWHWSIMPFIREVMGLSAAIVPPTAPDGAVPGRLGADPQPAGIRLVDFGPEAFLQRTAQRQATALRTTEATGAPLGRRPASFTGSHCQPFRAMRTGVLYEVARHEGTNG